MRVCGGCGRLIRAGRAGPALPGGAPTVVAAAAVATRGGLLPLHGAPWPLPPSSTVPAGPGWRRLRRALSTTTAAAAAGSNAAASSEPRAGPPRPAAAWATYPRAAVGRVMAAEANYVRVDVHRLGPAPQDGDAAAELTAAIISGSAAAPPEAGLDGGQQQQQQQQQQQGEDAAAAQAPPRQQLLCTVRALLKKVRQRVLVGDVVSVGSIDWAEGRGVVEGVLPRRSELVDPAIANVDHVVLLFGLTQPPFEEQQVSRFLVSVEAAGLPLTLALNKADLVGDDEVAARLAQCAEWGYRAVAVSCASRRGLGELGRLLAGKTSVVAGPSGAGKSSLINALRLGRHKAEGGGGAWWEGGAADVRWAVGGSSGSQDGEEEEDEEEEEGQDCAASGSGGGGGEDFLAVGDVSRFGRGKHTTRVVRLIPLPGGGLMADTPGFGLPTLDGISSAALRELFPEFRAALAAAPGGRCRFDDCAHLAEPGCAVNSAGLERYPHYLKFLAEVKVREDYDVRVMQLAKRQREGAVKLKTGRGGEARYEARLESKKHRVTSRKAAKQSILRAAEREEGAAEDLLRGDQEQG